jgi:putative beta-barrel porin BBP2
VPEGRDVPTHVILPCRIHQPRSHLGSFPLALLFAAFFLVLQPGRIWSQNAVGSTFEQAGLGWLPAIPIQITADLGVGYDDNVTLTPSGEGSLFVGENVVLTYPRPGERTQFYLLGIGRFDQYFNVSRNDVDANVTMLLTHNFSTRLSFYASVFAAYQTEPNFRSNVGPENVVSDHFYTSDIFSLTYHWSTRFSMITSYTFNRVQYTSSSVGNSQNRVQNTLGEEFQFSLTSRTVLVGEYRFEMINYDTAPTNSTTHYILAGFGHHLTEHLVFHVRGGEEFRSLENDGDMASPYFESSLGYVSSNHSLNWTTSYEFESSTAAGVTTTKTWRTGLTLTYGLTSRLSSTTGVFYHHDENTGGTGSTGSQDSFDLTAGLRYTINKHFTLHLNYNHTTLGSSGSTPGYSRNLYFAGLTYTF